MSGMNHPSQLLSPQLSRTFSPIPTGYGVGGAGAGSASSNPAASGGAATGSVAVQHPVPGTALQSRKLLERAVTFSVLTPPPSNIYVSGRRGGVLTRGMVLKSDHFATGRLLDIHVSGAPNFRQVRPTNLYGCGQPTVSGMRTVLNLMKSHVRARQRTQSRAGNTPSNATSGSGAAHAHAPHYLHHNVYPPTHHATPSSGSATPAGAAAAAAKPATPHVPTDAATAEAVAAMRAVQHRNSLHHTATSMPGVAHAAPAHTGSALSSHHSVVTPASASHHHTMPTVHWTNLREEPVVYLNNRPFVLRELDNPFRNMIDFQGIDVRRLEHIERRLKNDILREAEEHDGNILVHEEDEHTGDITPTWESVTRTSVLTSSEVYEQLKAEGYRVGYTRIPVPTESLFDTKHIDAILRTYALALTADPETLFIFNCQMGNSRSTMGMVIIFLLQCHLFGTPLLKTNIHTYSNVSTPAAIAASGVSSTELIPHSAANKQLSAFRRGEYDVMLRLMRMLDGGVKLKDEVDAAIDVCGRVINLRDSILESYLKAETARGKDEAKLHAMDTDVKLKRYFYLLCFDSYLKECSVDLSIHVLETHAFSVWLKGRPELQKLMQQSFVSDKKDGGSSAVVSLEADTVEPTDPMAALVWNRRGAVLGKRTILKKEWFAPLSRIERVLNVDGMSNFRHLRDTPLSATAQPSVHGIRAILDFLGAKASPHGGLKPDEKDGGSSLPPPLTFPNRTASAGTIGVTPLIDLSASGVAAPPSVSHQSSAAALAGMLAAGSGSSSGSPSLAPTAAPLTASSSTNSLATSPSPHPPLHPVAAAASRRTSYVYRTPATTQRIVWVNLREEPVVYIGANAYLLRDTTHPYRPMPEFSAGMTPDRSESMEERLRDDIVKEAIENGDRILIHEQVSNSEVRPKWQIVTPTASATSSASTTNAVAERRASPAPSGGGGSHDNRVRTPRQVFADLSKDDGYHVSYHRIPLYVEQAPGFRSFDRLMRLLNTELLPNTQIVFVCQRGGRRSTMAMIVTCLLLMQRGFLEWDFFRIKPPGADAANASAGTGAAANSSSGGDDQQELTIVSPVVGPSALTRALMSSGVGTSIGLPAPLPGAGGAAGSIARAASPAPVSRSQSSADMAGAADAAGDDDGAEDESSIKAKAHARGEYKGIMSLLRILKYGRQVKEQVDAVIDYCGNVHNIRLAIAQARAESDVERTAQKHTEHLAQAIKYLESYAYLICFHSYLWERRYHELEPTTTTNASIAATPTPAHAHPLPAATATAATTHTVDATPRLHPQEPSTSHPTGTIAGSLHPSSSSNSLFTAGGGGAASLLASPAPAMKRSPSAGAFSTTTGAAQPPAGGTTTTGSTTAAGAPFPTFHEWMKGRAELKAHLESFRKQPHEALKLDLGLSDELYTLLYENRNGNVLVRGSILKSDYFKGISAAPAPAPGAAASAPTAVGLGLVSASAHAATVPIDGAINFRLLDHFPVAGTGIPSDEGITNILRYFAWDTRRQSLVASPTNAGDSKSLIPARTPSPVAGASASSSAQAQSRFRASGAVWINLRGEPICYIHGRPFVLRDHDNPYLNLEHTGITRRRVEAQEKQLKKDVLAEAGVYHGKLFLHDEDEDGNLASYWDNNIKPEAVKTPSQMFHECFSYHQQILDGKNPDKLGTPSSHPLTNAALSALTANHPTFPLVYVRTPITDEQAPSPDAFDALVKALEANGSQPNRVLIFNCQMGRGRTTTGLITACLWCIHRGITTFQIVSNKKSADNTPATATTTVNLTTAAADAKASPVAAAKPGAALPTAVTIPLLAHPRASTTGTVSSPAAASGVTLPMSVHSKEEDDEEEEEIRKLNLRGPAPTTAVGGPAVSSPPFKARLSGGAAPPALALSIDTKAAVQPTAQAVPATPSPADLARLEQKSRALLRGWYKVIQSLVRVLTDGVDLKKQVDRVIDHCAAFQNLRDCVYETQLKATDALDSKKEALIRRGTNYLIRYFYLICFAAYFRDETVRTTTAGTGATTAGHRAFTRSFQVWLAERPEIQNMVANVVFPE